MGTFCFPSVVVGLGLRKESHVLLFEQSDVEGMRHGLQHMNVNPEHPRKRNSIIRIGVTVEKDSSFSFLNIMENTTLMIIQRS